MGRHQGTQIDVGENIAVDDQALGRTQVRRAIEYGAPRAQRALFTGKRDLYPERFVCKMLDKLRGVIVYAQYDMIDARRA